VLKNEKNLIVLTPLLLCLHWAATVHLQVFEPTTTADFGLWGTHTYSVEWKTQLASALFILFTALTINYTFNHNNFFHKNTALPAFIYVIGMFFFENIYIIDGLLLSHLILITALFQLLRITNNKDARKIIFNASFLCGLAISLFPSHFIIIPSLVLIIGSMRLIILRELLLSICGLSLPIIYAFSFQLLTDTYDPDMLKISFQEQSWQQELHDLTFPSLFIVFVIINLIGLRQQLHTSTIIFRKKSIVLLIFFLSTILVSIFHLAWKGETNGFSTTIIGIALLSFFGRHGRILSYFYLFFLLLLVIGSVFSFFL